MNELFHQRLHLLKAMFDIARKQGTRQEAADRAMAAFAIIVPDAGDTMNLFFSFGLWVGMQPGAKGNFAVIACELCDCNATGGTPHLEVGDAFYPLCNACYSARVTIDGGEAVRVVDSDIDPDDMRVIILARVGSVTEIDMGAGGTRSCRRVTDA